ncbi:MAG: metallophosphatase domain-containing protein [Planctomycetota bacterium]|jgi:Icc-related predicted phosphoesterase
MRLVLISDTHARHRRLAIPDGDVLVHAGDFSAIGGVVDLLDIAGFFAEQPHEHKVLVAGNHDVCLFADPDEARARLGAVHVLQDSGVELGGVKFWGSAWQPEFMGVYQLPRGEPLREVWERMPDDTDVLVTHTPPHGILDETLGGLAAGCEELRERMRAVRPRLHVFGHIHEGRGQVEIDGTRFVNATSVGRRREMFMPVVVDL